MNPFEWRTWPRQIKWGATPAAPKAPDEEEIAKRAASRVRKADMPESEKQQERRAKQRQHSLAYYYKKKAESQGEKA